jgi:hypothetical protein
MHIFKAIENKLTIVTTSIEQRNFLIAVLDYMQQEPALPFNADNELNCYWVRTGEYLFTYGQSKPTSKHDALFTDLDLTFSIKQLSAIWGKHSSTVHQLLKRPENWKHHNIASKNKCGKEIQVTLKFQ